MLCRGSHTVGGSAGHQRGGTQDRGPRRELRHCHVREQEHGQLCRLQTDLILGCPSLVCLRFSDVPNFNIPFLLWYLLFCFNLYFSASIFVFCFNLSFYASILVFCFNLSFSASIFVFCFNLCFLLQSLYSASIFLFLLQSFFFCFNLSFSASIFVFCFNLSFSPSIFVFCFNLCVLLQSLFSASIFLLSASIFHLLNLSFSAFIVLFSLQSFLICFTLSFSASVSPFLLSVWEAEYAATCVLWLFFSQIHFILVTPSLHVLISCLTVTLSSFSF